MPSLKSLKTRIKSVKSTQKITKAMKMVAAAKLRRATEAAQASRPYAERMERMLMSLAGSLGANDNVPKLLAGTGKDDTHLIIVATSDRGLCGAFNGSIVRAAKKHIAELQSQGKKVKIYSIGRKGYSLLLLQFRGLIINEPIEISKKKRIAFQDADDIARDLIGRFDAGEFDTATIVFNQFKSAISQVVTFQQLIPLASTSNQQPATSNLVYEYEPSEAALLADLLPRNIGVQLFKALLENAASEQGARMSAMDNATRNAGDMIKRLNLVYNRSRQAAITKELIEIISGAEAV